MVISTLFILSIIWRWILRLTKIKLKNYRCFGPEEQVVCIDNMTAFIGNNSSGKTAALSALNCIFSENQTERILKRSDFHIPKEENIETFNHQDLYVEAVFEFNELKGVEDTYNAIPCFFQNMVVDCNGAIPILRIRLEATWEKSNALEGAIDSSIYYILCSEDETITDDKKAFAKRNELDQIRVIYVPAVRDTEKQLKNASGSKMHAMMNSINWSDDSKNNIKDKIDELNQYFTKEKGVSLLNDSIHEQWRLFDSDERYYDSALKCCSTDLESVIRKAEITFKPTVTGKEYYLNEMGDGLKSLFYFSLVSSILDLENKIKSEIDDKSENPTFNIKPPALTIMAIEEPENHIAPHLIGKLIKNINEIAEKTNAQVILSSHSPSVVKRIEPENIRHFRIEKEDCSTRVKELTLPMDTDEQYKYIKEAVKAYPELYFAKLVILGEGDSEEIILKKFFEAKNGDIDSSNVSIVPLGGRHVNYFWKLLNDLKIPYITLLDLDRERFGGGWGRIKYVLNELLVLDYDRSEILQKANGSELSGNELNNLHKIKEYNDLAFWLEKLKKYHVYFSAPLDIDFLLLMHYESIYKSLCNANEGPRIAKQKKGKDIETLFSDGSFSKKIKKYIKAVLKDKGGNGSSYSNEEKQLMPWYEYFFLNRGKPITHVKALSLIESDKLLDKIPLVFEEMFKDARKQLEG